MSASTRPKSPSQLECVSAAAAGSVPLTVDHADGGPRGTAVPFTYFDPEAAPAIASAAPPYAPLAGAAAISVHGANFAPPWHHTTPSYLCRFGDLEVGRGTDTATFVTGVSFAAPRRPPPPRTPSLSASSSTAALPTRAAAPPTRRLSTITTLRPQRPLTPTLLWRSTSRPARSRRSPYAAAASHRRTAPHCRVRPVGVAVAAFVTTGELRVTPPRAAAPRVVTLTVHNTLEERREEGRRYSLLTTTPRGRRT